MRTLNRIDREAIDRAKSSLVDLIGLAKAGGTLRGLSSRRDVCSRARRVLDALAELEEEIDES